tara:strand:- start:69 stop:965 length:897 start_codon:yes stop_codon:yes gene_type:complete
MSLSDSFTLTTDDGVVLQASGFRARSPRAVVVMAGGTGIPRQFYRHFSAFLANRGLHVITFDYRGKDSAVAADRLRMADWGRQDLDTVLAHAAQRFPDLPLLFVGHSVGGQIFGLARHSVQVQAALLIASQSGYWRHWPGAWRWRRWLDWHFLMPAMTRLVGELPGWMLGGSPLPAGISDEWGRWCRSPHYLCERDGAPMRDHFARLRLPMRFYAVSDDAGLAPLAAVRALMGFYPVAGKELQLLSPADAGVAKLGHFGVFRKSASVLWPPMVEWLLAALSRSGLSQAGYGEFLEGTS